MDIVVCVKNVPETADEDLEINDEATDVEREDLVFSLNEWDGFAVEEAVRIKEKHGGKVTVVTVGEEKDEDILRRCLAMGADEAVLVSDDALEGSDADSLSLVLAKTVSDLPHDLVFTGVQAGDDGYGFVGPALAERLNLPYATLVTKTEITAGCITAERELEAGMYETVDLALPALLTIQSGINEPRYVSIMGIRKVRSIEIGTRDLEGLGIGADRVGRNGSRFETIEVSLPPEGEGAEILKGSLEEVCGRVAALIRDKGGLA